MSRVESGATEMSCVNWHRRVLLGVYMVPVSIPG